jgi:hypothetical protein
MAEGLLPPAPTMNKKGEPLHHTAIRQVREKRERQEIFLKAYRQTGTVRNAADAAGVAEGTHNAWQQTDLEYRLVFQMVRAQLADDLEGLAFNRARYGTKKPVYQGGQKVGEIVEHDFRREQFFLQHWKQGVYGPRLDITVSNRTDDEVKTRMIEVLRQAGVDWDGDGEPPKMVDAEVVQPEQI